MTPSVRPNDGASIRARPHQPKWSQRFLAALFVLLERLLISSLRFRITDESGLIVPLGPQRVSFALWHNRLAVSMACYRKFLLQQDPNRHLVALISASRDGALLACTLEKLKVTPVRGSSSRRGAQALLELASAARRGDDIAITPDGPRGPRYQVQEGLVTLSHVTQLPIIPVAIRYQWKKRLRSWDRFEIPLPFSKCEIRILGPILPLPSITPEQRTQAANRIQNLLLTFVDDPPTSR